MNTLCAMLGCCALATAPLSKPQDAVNMSFHLREDKLPLGAPLVLHVKVSGPIGQGIRVMWTPPAVRLRGSKEQLPPWLDAHLEDQAGNIVPSVEDVHTGTGESGGLPREILSTHAMTFTKQVPYFEDDVVLGLWLRAPVPGRYKLVLEPCLRYVVGQEPTPLMEPAPHVYRQRVELPVTVSMYLPGVLLQRAKALVTKVHSPGSATEYSAAMRELAAMPLDVALPVWQDAILNNKLDGDELIRLITGFAPGPETKAISDEMRRRQFAIKR